ncbi:MAG: 50S ribosomal protein L10, partial [Gammaproteobacteria bacterium]
MTLRLEDKKTIAEEVNAVAKDSIAAVTAEYRGLTVSQMNQMRSVARQRGIYLRVVRNTLTRIAIKETKFACLDETLTGPLVVAFSKDSPSAPARLFKEFAKEFEALTVKALAVDGQLYHAKQLDAVASLPSKEEAISTLLSVMQAPISKLVRTLAATPQK